MKKLFLILIFCIFTSCDKYYKDDFISKEIGGETYYCLRVFNRGTFTNTGAIKVYYLREDEITEENIDSLRREADKFINLLNKKL